MAEIKKGNDQGHHIVPKSYLNQWKDTDNQLEVFTHGDGKYQRRGSDWSAFKRKNYNIYDDDEEYFLPERITEGIDAQAIEVIKSLTSGKQLSGMERSILAHYVALQYVRTPRFREESDLVLEEQIKEPFLENQRQLTDEDLLEMKRDAHDHIPENKRDEMAINEIRGMSDETFIKNYREFIASGDMRVGLNKFGHSKFIFKVPEKAEGLFSFMWFFFIAPRDSSFITSDNPCFAVPREESESGVGLFSKNGLVIFPLRPDICLIISPNVQSWDERYKKLSKTATREINRLIVKHSYEIVVGKSLPQLQSLLKGYIHSKTRKIETKEFGDYKLTTLK